MESAQKHSRQDGEKLADAGFSLCEAPLASKAAMELRLCRTAVRICAGKNQKGPAVIGVGPFWFWRARQDSNLRPMASEATTLSG